MSRKQATPAHVYRRRRLLAVLMLLIVAGGIFRLIDPRGEQSVLDAIESIAPFKDPCPESNPFPEEFVSAWATQHNAQDFQAVAYNVDTDCTYQIGSATNQYQMASTIKVMIAIAELERVSRGEVALADIKDDLTQMITVSDNDATQRLWDNQAGMQSTTAVATEFKLSHTSINKHWGISMSNAVDQTALFKQAVVTKPASLNDESWNFLRKLLGSVDPEQDWGAGYGLPATWEFMVKNGWYHTTDGDDGPDNKSRVNTVGTAIDDSGKHRWIFSGYSNTWDTDAQGIDAWNALSTQIVSTWAN